MRREKRTLRWTLGQWGYWRRWDYPKEAVRAILDGDERIQRALRHFQRFNEAGPSEKMRIYECTHVWDVYRTEPREELEWLQQQDEETDSAYDDIMQQ